MRLTWFEIPVSDLERAVRFYSYVFDVIVPIKDKTASYGSIVGILLEQDGQLVALTKNTPYVPSKREGCIIYFDVGETGLDKILMRTKRAGGQVLLPATPVQKGGQKGNVAWIEDSEGNRIGLLDYGPDGFKTRDQMEKNVKEKTHVN